MRAANDVSVGDRVGEFRVIGTAPGSQWRAAHVATGERVILDVRVTDDWRLIGVQFLRAQVAVLGAQHPGMAKIVAHGVLEPAQRGERASRPWVASELVHGDTLAEVLAARQMLTLDECQRLVRAIASVLAHAHACEIVHGNLRPHHIVIARGATRGIGSAPGMVPYPVCIGDWVSQRAPGIPTWGDPPVPNVFVAPEHLRGPIDTAADVFTLGAIAYRCLTGVFHDVDRDRLTDACTGSDGRLGETIREMLSTRPDYRPSAAEVVEALAA